MASSDNTGAEAFEQTLEFLENIIRTIAQPVFVKDRAHRWILVNDAFCRLAGHRREDLLGRTDFDYFDPQEARRFWESDDAVFETGLETVVDELFTDPQGTSRVVRTLKTAFRTPSTGEFVLVGVLSDITEHVAASRNLEAVRNDLGQQVEARTAELQRANEELRREIEERARMEKSLRETEAKLSSMNCFLEGIIDTIRDPIFIKDSSHRWVLLNQGACDLWGYRKEDLLGKSDYDFFPREQADVFWEKDAKVMESGHLDINEEFLTDSKGFTHVLSTKKSRLVTASGERFLVGIITDITAQKQAESELRAAKAQAENANRAKSIFLANMSHEIRTPLNNIQGLIDLLDLTEVSGEQREYLRMARLSGRDLMRLINDVLDLSAIEAGKAPLDIVTFDLPDLVQALVKTFNVASQKKGVKLSCGPTVDLPRHVKGDPGRLRQVLTNLLGNAVKFTPEGGQIRLSAEVVMASQSDCRLRFRVTDTGIGIPEGQLGLIFNAFTQLDSSTTKRYAGTGLGLYIVKVLTEMMGGSVSVRSDAGKGSEFSCEIPFELSAEPVASSESTTRDSAGSEGIRILVAEDNPGTQFLLKALLNKLGYQHVVVVGDGQRAVEETAVVPFDIVLMDVQMPEMDGCEATRAIREREKAEGRTHLPIVACTAYAMEEDRERCLQAGMDGVLTKPVDSRVLEQVIRNWVLGK